MVRDSVTNDGETLENTFDWHAQDPQGSVWYLGEQTAEFEEGKQTSTAGSLEADVDGALPGVTIPVEPEAGMRYRHGYYEGEAEDNGEILSVGEEMDAPAGHYDDAPGDQGHGCDRTGRQRVRAVCARRRTGCAFDVSGGSSREELIAVATVSDDVAIAAGTVPLGESYLQ